MDSGKYVRYTNEQVEALERVYNECPKPSSARRSQLLQEYPILANIEPKQIKVWFQNRRCREKQRKEATRLINMNAKLSALNKMLMEENERLMKQTTELSMEVHVLRQELAKYRPPPQSNGENLGLGDQMASDMVGEFLGKATGTAVDWANMPGTKNGPDTFEMVFILRGGPGIASRVYGLVLMEPAKVASALKDRSQWLRECRKSEVLGEFRTDQGTVEVVYTQICERSMSGGTNLEPVPAFVRAEMHPSGYYIKPCNGNSIIYIVDHVDLKPLSVPEVLRPLYESSAALAQRQTMEALRYLRRLASDSNLDSPRSNGHQALAWRGIAERIARGFNEAVNGFPDDGWVPLMGDGMDDVSVAARPLNGQRHSGSNPAMSGNSEALRASEGGVLCAKASMLLQVSKRSKK
ncbi:hypothetical protein CBR_g84830 [Chara braunii]|uniref:Uncharacterized protein n=1 Tax=Chara braunii TaxID=69332 RepID=A0A388KAZ0_CHABU|nr:hypothetical protein CBR_g84830 [Chara braunii]|eukprot:GBG67166.1 hypothetical protein CBR_g84830 [Chara braunii]